MPIRLLALGAAAAVLAWAGAGRGAGGPYAAPVARGDSITIPASVIEDHHELIARLTAATRERGPVGEAAHELAETLQPHFEREEQIALPPLGLLRALAEGRLPAEAAAVVPLTDSLAAELPRMLEEHRDIQAAVRRFEAVARSQGGERHLPLVAMLRHHARSEEEVLYPAAVLVGEVVRARMAAGRR